MSRVIILVVSPGTTQRPPAMLQHNPGLSFVPTHQNTASPRPMFNTWHTATVSSGYPTTNMTVNAVRGVQPYNTGVHPTMYLPGQQPMMIPGPAQPLLPSGNSSWSANIVNRIKTEEPKSREPSPLDVLGQEALSAHKESQGQSKIDKSQFQPKDSMLLDIGDSTSSQITPIPPPPSAVQMTNGPKAKNDLTFDQVTLSMDKIQPG